MKPAAVLAVALLGVGALVYLALDPGGERGGLRGEGARSEREGGEPSRSEPEAVERGPRPEGFVGLHVVVRPAGVAEVILTGPRTWRGRTDERGALFAGWTAPGRYAISAHRDGKVAAKSFDVEGRTTVELQLAEAIEIRGRVHDAAGRPITGATVRAMPEAERTGVHRGWRIAWLAANARPPIHAEARTGADGAYTLHVQRGHYTLEARARGFAGEDQPARRYDARCDAIDFYLQPGARVAGRVLGPDEQPVAGALVVVTAGREAPSLAYSDSTGVFELDVPVGGWNQLAVRAHGYAPAMVGNVRPPVEGITVRIDRGVQARAKLLIEGTGGQPAAGVEAMLSFSGGSRATVSDEDGIVAFPLVPTAGSTMNFMHLMVAGGGFVPTLKSVNGVQARDGVVDLGEFELAPGATIRGRVTDQATGAAIEGAAVRWFSPTLRGVSRNAVAGSTTDSDGRYELTGVAADVAAILVAKDGYATNLSRAEAWKRAQDKKARLLAPGQMLLEQDIELAAAGVVSGLALDPEDNPLPGVVVRGPMRGQMTGDLSRPTAVSDEQGRFELAGYADGTRLMLEARHIRYGSVEPVRVVAGDGKQPVLRFHSPVRVMGRVVDVDDNPVAQAIVVAAKPPLRGRPQFERNPPRATTDADGRFVLRTVPPGERELKITHDLHLIRVEPLPLSPDEPEYDAGELRLERGPGIAGFLVNEAGEPVAGATVTMSWSQPSEAARVKVEPSERLYVQVATGRDGRFACYGLKQGNYRIAANVPGLFAEQPIVATGAAEVTLTVREGKTWNGRVLAAGEPVSGAFVSARHANQQAWIASGMTGDDGSIVLRPLPPDGAFDLHVEHKEFKPLQRKGVTAAAMPAEISLEVGSIIAGVVVDSDGKPIAGANIQARAVEGKGFKWTQTNEDGTFALAGLDENRRYSIKVSWTREQHVPGDPIEAQPGGEPVRFELARGLTISGKLATSDAEKLGNVRIVAHDKRGKPRATAWVFAPRDLAFKINALGAGTYTLKVISGWGENEAVLAELEGVEAGAGNVEIRADG